MNHLMSFSRNVLTIERNCSSLGRKTSSACLRCVALRNRGQSERFPFGLQGAEHDVYGRFTAVLARTIKLEPGAHEARVRRGMITLLVGDMRRRPTPSFGRL